MKKMLTAFVIASQWVKSMQRWMLWVYGKAKRTGGYIGNNNCMKWFETADEKEWAFDLSVK